MCMALTLDCVTGETVDFTRDQTDAEPHLQSAVCLSALPSFIITSLKYFVSPMH